MLTEPAAGSLQRDRAIALACSSTSLGYMLVFNLTRFALSASFIASLSFALGAIYFGRRWARVGRFGPYFASSLVYLLLSFQHYLPTAWTIYWDPIAGLRHWSWAFLVPVYTASFAIFFRLSRKHITKYALEYCVCFFIVSRISLFFAPMEYDVDTQGRLTIYTFVAENAAVTFFLAIYLIYRVKPSLFAVMLLAPLLPLFTSSQSAIGYSALLFVWFFGYGNVALSVLTISLMAFLVTAPSFVSELYALDHNTGFRALLWHDSREAFLQSHAVGVGFGTEYIKNDFSYYDVRGWKITKEDAANRLLIGTHSTVYDVLMRTGIVGIMSLIYWFADLLRAPMRGASASSKMNSFAAILLMLINTVNMGVTSTNFMLGTCMCAGWLLTNRSALRRPNGAVNLSKLPLAKARSQYAPE